MKNCKTLSIAVVTALPLTSLGSFAAESVSATGNTLDNAEAHIAAKAKAANAKSYKITSARTNAGVYMTVELYK